MSKIQYSISIEKEVMEKFDAECARLGIGRSAAISVLLDQLPDLMRWKKPEVVRYQHDSLVCECAKCAKERDDAERHFEAERGN